MSQLTSGFASTLDRPEVPASAGFEGLVASAAETESIRGVTDAAADVSECVCPEPCERDHANE